MAAVTVSLLGLFDGFKGLKSSIGDASTSTLVIALALISIVIGLFAYLHFRIRNIAAARVLKKIEKQFPAGLDRERMRQAFIHNTRPWHSIFRKSPIGWTSRGRKRLQQVIAEANQYVQTLNDKFTDPSGDMTPEEKASTPLAVAGPVSQEGQPEDTGSPDEVQRNPD